MKKLKYIAALAVVFALGCAKEDPSPSGTDYVNPQNNLLYEMNMSTGETVTSYTWDMMNTHAYTSAKGAGNNSATGKFTSAPDAMSFSAHR